MGICCPDCGCTNIKKNGHIHNGKQNYHCNECGRQFVENSTQKRISDRDKELIKRLLLERISLRGICPVMEVSLQWLLEFIFQETALARPKGVRRRSETPVFQTSPFQSAKPKGFKSTNFQLVVVYYPDRC